MPELLALGVSHKTSPLEMRERLALTEGAATAVLRELVASEAISEAAAISTCNRTEIYLYASDPVEAESVALGVLARGAEIRLTELVPHIYSEHTSSAVEHLFRVTAGLDSMILGEAEIQGQVKRAYELSLVEGATGPVLNRLFRSALAAGGRARAETRIAEGALSVPQVAVELARRTLGDLAERQVVVVGAGETAELTARALAARGTNAVFIANRHHDRAIGLAQRFGGKAVRFEDLPALLADVDIVVSSTSSPHYVIDREALEEVIADRDGKQLLLIDLAVPRDVHPGTRELAGVTVHDMDDLQSLVERNTSGREIEAHHAESILASEQRRFETWLASQEVTPTVAGLRRRADEIVERTLAENADRWEGMTEADRARLGKMASAIASRILHEPTLRVKRAAADESAHVYVHALRELFGLDSASEPIDAHGADAEVTELDSRRRERRS